MKRGFACLLGFFLLLSAQTTLAKNDGLFEYEFTVTNLTQGQWITPILSIAHGPDFTLWEAGQDVGGTPIETLAETGNPGPLNTEVGGNAAVHQTVIAPDPNGLAGVLLPPGQSVTFRLPATPGQQERLSLIAMLTPTNDAFWALQGVRAPRVRQSATYFARAYDAGTEINSEQCGEIPGPPSLGELLGCSLDPSEGAVSGSPENGVIHVHNGIHGEPNVSGSELNPMDQDWRNPVAQVTIRHDRVY